MSSILKALQKLERDREARQAKPADIQRGILRQSRRAGTPTPWKLPVAVCATALLATLATYLFMKGGTGTGGQISAAPAAPVAIPTPSAPEAVVPQQQTTTQPPQRPQSIVNDRPILTAPRRTPASPSLNDGSEPSRPAEPIKEAAPPPPAASPSQFTVAGIGWRDDPASRMAMVNGSAVRVGSMVDGARVEEIFPDRVRFNYQQRSFEVQLGKSVSPSP
jgi:general secretion pathway protein B